MKDTLLFIDVTTPRPYDPATKEGKGIGGTEQTMVQLAEGLGALGTMNVVVEQHNRPEGETYEGSATYTSIGKTEKARWVVVLRDPRPMVDARKRFPDAKIYLYSHDLADRNLGMCYDAGFFSDSGCLANVCVSSWHRTQSIELFKVHGYHGEFRHKFIHNPIGDDVVYTGGSYDKNKLIWLASPHKGLSKAYEIFKRLVKINPEFRLYVTNPGYMEDVHTNDQEIKDKVVVLGTLPHSDVIEHLRNSLCLFYPNTVFPETFGKIMAEANEVGTPCITSGIGAAREVLDSHPEQIVDCRDTEAVVKRVMKWYSGARPFVRGRPQFKLKNILPQWIRLLNDVR